MLTINHFYGAPGRIRTCYPRLRRPMLYPDELRAPILPAAIVVGAEGFEPPTLWSQTRCATKLRYAPKIYTPWWPEAESNCRHEDFQSTALPTELSGR